MDCIIFLYLGMAVLEAVQVSDYPKTSNTELIFFQEIGSSGWYVGFILWTIILCLLVRFIGVYIFTFIANKWGDISIPAIKSFPGSV